MARRSRRSESRTTPWCVSSPEAGLAGVMQMAFSPYTASALRSAVRYDGISAIRPAAPAGVTTVRNGCWARPDVSADSAPRIAAAHSE